MELKDLFYSWVPVPVKLLVLFMLLFVILTANGVFFGNINDMYSSSGNYIEVYTMAVNSLYIGMGLGLIFEIRLKFRFSNKALLFTGLVCILVFNIICGFTDNPVLFILSCFLLGFTKILALTEVYLIWLVIWSKILDSSRLYPFVYFIALAGLYFVTWVTTSLGYLYNWRYAYIFMILLVLACILLTMIFVENHPLRRKIPLYQIDYPGILYLSILLMGLNYIFVYAKVEDWFNATKIKAASLLVVFCTILFIKRQLTVKRPFFDLSLFGNPGFRAGLMYFFLLGIFAPSTFQTAFSSGILLFDSQTNAQINLYLIPGILAGSVLSFIWYYKKQDGNILIFFGFASLVVYHVYMYNGFSASFGVHDFIIPVMIKGFGTILIYISVGLLAARNIPLLFIMSCSGLVIIVRSFVGSGVFAGVYNYLLYAERIRSFNRLASGTDSSNPFLKQTNQPQELYVRLQQQSVLAASKELSGYIVITGLLLLLILLISYGYIKLKKRILFST